MYYTILFFCISLIPVELVVNERKIGSIIHARHSNPFISLQCIEYIVTGDSVYYSGSLPYRRSRLYSANVIIQNVN
jgi:methyl coenzyme M reductase gamma subunit